MRKINSLTVGATLTAVLIMSACGKINWQETEAAAKDYRISVQITSDIDAGDDPCIFLITKDMTFDRNSFELSVTEAFLSSSSQRNSFAIKISNAKFSVPFGGKIRIVYPNGRVEILERYGKDFIDWSRPLSEAIQKN
ncbi:MAG: hypothetical protein HY506_02465 [Candidatus Yanofskybacteria bacterium]|nr:hypothetical protein [Candidatus Yanofskybacteria bacterium]